MAQEQGASEEFETPDQVEDLMTADGGPAVIDFWSPSCGPCVAMLPDFEAVAHEFEEDPIRFIKINTGEHPYLAAPFKIRATPTVLFVNNGEVVDAVVGRMDARRLFKRSEWLLKKATSSGLLSRLFGGTNKQE